MALQHAKLQARMTVARSPVELSRHCRLSPTGFQIGTCGKSRLRAWLRVFAEHGPRRRAFYGDFGSGRELHDCSVYISRPPRIYPKLTLAVRRDHHKSNRKNHHTGKHDQQNRSENNRKESDKATFSSLKMAIKNCQFRFQRSGHSGRNP